MAPTSNVLTGTPLRVLSSQAAKTISNRSRSGVRNLANASPPSMLTRGIGLFGDIKRVKNEEEAFAEEIGWSICIYGRLYIETPLQKTSEIYTPASNFKVGIDNKVEVGTERRNR